MAACPHTTICGLGRTISMPEALRVWESLYCEAAFHRCERYELVSTGSAMPDRLLPNGRLLEPGEGAPPDGAASGG